MTTFPLPTTQAQSPQAESPQSGSLYESDYVVWLDTTLQQLKQRNYNHVDWENLIEEIEYLSRKERQSMESNLIVLMLHLLKWQYQPERRSGSWSGSIVEHRRRVNRALTNSPSLKPYLEKVIDSAYEEALEQAVAETALPADLFPAKLPYQISQILERGFLPETKKQ